MKKTFFLQFTCFWLLFLLLGYFFVFATEHFTTSYTRDDAHANLVYIAKQKTYDVVFLGSSHAITVFGNKKTYKDTSAILHKKYLTLANAGSGVLPQKIYLDYFFAEKNKTTYVVYLLDPWALYYRQWNEENYFVAEEAFRIRFLSLLLTHPFDRQVPIEYIRNKFTYLRFIPEQKIKQKILSKKDITPDLIAKTLHHYYPRHPEEKNFQHYSVILEDMIKLAKKNNSQVIFIIPPTLLAKNLPGIEEEKKLLNKLQHKYDVHFYDYSSAITDPSLYLDMDHLNRQGADLFTEKFVKPILP